jgi:hypothetical protein
MNWRNLVPEWIEGLSGLITREPGDKLVDVVAFDDGGGEYTFVAQLSLWVAVIAASLDAGAAIQFALDEQTAKDMTLLLFPRLRYLQKARYN